MSEGPAVNVQLAGGVELPSQARIEAWVLAALDHLRADGHREVGVRLVDAGESQRMNHRYRGRERPTNVLAFPQDPVPGLPAEEALPLGDLIVCMPLVHSEAAAQDKTPLAHLAHLIVHGTLHLLGLDHQDPAAAEHMEGLEREILAGLGFEDPYRDERTRGVMS